MIKEIRIKNFKSIVDLKLDLGKFNVIIGPNGCGKTNILEAITFASAATQEKLDTEFLLNRDIRITDPQFMFNAFEDIEDEQIYLNEMKLFENISFPDDVKILKNNVIGISIKEDSKEPETDVLITYIDKTKQWINILSFIVSATIQKASNIIEKEYKEKIETLRNSKKAKKIEKLIKDIMDVTQRLQKVLSKKSEFTSFLTYHPSDTFLRKVFEPSIFPFGIKGEGLLGYLKKLDKTEENTYLMKKINDGLHLLDWFESVFVPEDLSTNEYKLSIGDKYLKETVHYFDQRSTNEGFLYLLFYLVLFNSSDTPPFFAVDNIETALNPKLCTKLTEYLVDASIKNNKQVILTTHSPYVLDGLDLANDDVRLFVARRDIDGHTRLERIEYREDRNMLLSELWMSGLIGGLPDNF